MGTKFYSQPTHTNTMASKHAPYQPYVPQYKLMGIEPKDTYSANEHRQFNTHNRPILVKGKPDMFQAAAKPISRNVPFAELPPNTQQTQPILNVGNNIENTWTEVDGNIIDDVGLNNVQSNASMIDNNEYVEIESSTASSIPETITNNIAVLDEEYWLCMDNSIIAAGSLNFIENEVKELVFGEHQLCKGKAISADDLIVLKKVKIKVGVFIDE